MELVKKKPEPEAATFSEAMQLILDNANIVRQLEQDMRNDLDVLGDWDSDFDD